MEAEEEEAAWEADEVAAEEDEEDAVGCASIDCSPSSPKAVVKPDEVGGTG